MTEKHSDETTPTESNPEASPVSSEEPVECLLGNGVLRLDWDLSSGEDTRVVCSGGWKSIRHKSFVALGIMAKAHHDRFGCKFRKHYDH